MHTTPTHRARRHLAAAALAAAALLAGACGDDASAGSGPSSPSTAPGDTAPEGSSVPDGAATPACELLDDAQITEVAGTVSGTGELEAPLAVSTCEWQTAGGAVTLVLYDGPQFFDESAWPGAEPVADLGDEAIVTEDFSSGGATVAFVQGSDVAVLTVLAEAAVDDVVALASELAERL